MDPQQYDFLMFGRQSSSESNNSGSGGANTDSALFAESGSGVLPYPGLLDPYFLQEKPALQLPAFYDLQFAALEDQQNQHQHQHQHQQMLPSLDSAVFQEMDFADLSIPDGDDDMLLAYQLEQLQQLRQQERDTTSVSTTVPTPTELFPTMHSQPSPLPSLQQLAQCEAEGGAQADEVLVDEMRSVWSLTEHEVGYMNFHQLVRMIGTQGLDSRQEEDFKALRRKVRNRKSALKCSRDKRSKNKALAVVNVELEGRMEDMQHTIDTLAGENATLRNENRALSRTNFRQEQEIAELRNQIDALAAALQQQSLSFAGAA